MFLDEEPGAASAAELTRQTLIDTQERLGVMMDVMPMGLLIHTQQGALYANKEAARVLGSGQNDMIGRHFLDFLETSVEDAREQMEAAFAGGGEVKTTEATLKASDGSLRTIQIIACARRRRPGRAVTGKRSTSDSDQTCHTSKEEVRQ